MKTKVYNNWARALDLAMASGIVCDGRRCQSPSLLFASSQALERLRRMFFFGTAARLIQKRRDRTCFLPLQRTVFCLPLTKV